MFLSIKGVIIKNMCSSNNNISGETMVQKFLIQFKHWGEDTNIIILDSVLQQK